MNDATIRDAATTIVLRDAQSDPKLLMGQRGSKAAFMPNKYVFPGGAVDVTDADATLAKPLPKTCAKRLGPRADVFALAAIRELWEETGLALGVPDETATQISAPTGWQDFYAAGNLPSAAGMRYVFRAITPAGRPRRFDAHFFLVDAAHIVGDLDDFSKASDELSHLHWVRLSEARDLDLPFITEVVLAEINALATETSPPASVPFFDNSGPKSQFLRLP